MNKINIGRVILAGIVTGVVLNVGEFLLNTVVFAKQMEEMFKRLSVPPPGNTFILVAVLLTFLLGIVMMWMYALARPRLGPSPKTAIVVALIAWFCIYIYTGIFNSMLLGLSLSLTLAGMAWGLGEYILGSIAGAWLYKE